MLRLSILLSILFIPLILAQDYYSILGVSKGAGDKDIKSAYRQLSKKYHPDKNPGDDSAHNKFIEVGEAYEVLSDPEKRKIYDQYGAEALKNNGGQGGGQGPRGGGFHDPFDIFEQMFGGGGGGQRQRRRARGHNLETREELTLKEYYRGTSIDFNLNLNDFCEHCEGSGSQDGKVTQCPDCKGHGIVVQIVRMGPVTQQIQQMCGKCQGRGNTIKNKCKYCHGEKVVRKPKSFHVDVPPGAPRNFVEVKQGESDKGPDFDAGDLFIKFSETSRDNLGYRRRGDDLFRTEVLSLREALKGGWEREIEFLDAKRKVKIKRASSVVTNNGEIERIPGFGMPKEHNKFGDLYIDYVVIVPDDIATSPIKDEL